MGGSRGATPETAVGPRSDLALSHEGREIAMGVLITIVAESLITMGYIQMKMSHRSEVNRVTSESPSRLQKEPPLLRSVISRPRWWLALGLFFCATMCSLVAWSLAPMTVLAPTSCVSVLMNVVLCRLYFDEKLTEMGCLGTTAVFFGGLCTLISGRHDGSAQRGRIDASRIRSLFSHHRSFALFAALHALCLCVCLFIAIRWSTRASSKPTRQTNADGIAGHSSHYSSNGNSTDLIPSSTNDDDNHSYYINTNDIREEGECLNRLDNKKDFERDYRIGAAFDIDHVQRWQQQRCYLDGNRRRVNHTSDDNGEPEHLDLDGKPPEKVLFGQQRGSLVTAGPVTAQSLAGSMGIVFDESGEGCYDLITTLTSQSPMCIPERMAYIVRGLAFAFATAGVISWLQLVGKALLTLFEAVFKGETPMNQPDVWILLCSAVLLIALQVRLVSEVMRIFDAVLIVPLISSMVIIEQAMLNECYFRDWNEMSAVRATVFTVGLLTVLFGMSLLTHAHSSISLARYKDGKVRLSEARTERDECIAGDTCDTHYSYDRNHQSPNGMMFGEPEWRSSSSDDEENSWDISISEADEHYDLLHKIYG